MGQRDDCDAPRNSDLFGGGPPGWPVPLSMTKAVSRQNRRPVATQRPEGSRGERDYARAGRALPVDEGASIIGPFDFMDLLVPSISWIALHGLAVDGARDCRQGTARTGAEESIHHPRYRQSLLRFTASL